MADSHWSHSIPTLLLLLRAGRSNTRHCISPNARSPIAVCSRPLGFRGADGRVGRQAGRAAHTKGNHAVIHNSPPRRVIVINRGICPFGFVASTEENGGILKPSTSTERLSIFSALGLMLWEQRKDVNTLFAVPAGSACELNRMQKRNNRTARTATLPERQLFQLVSGQG